MRSRFNSDLQDDFDVFDTLGSTIGASFSTQAGEDRDSRSGNQPVELLGTPPLTSEAALALGSQSGGTAAVTTLTAGGITINLLFDAAATAAPASFRAAITQAASLLTAAISDQITVNIKIDYSGSGGGAAGGPDNGQYLGYSTVRTDLLNHATPGDAAFSALPGGTSIQGQANVAVWNAQLKLWGLIGANDRTTDDGSATFATDINPNLLVGVALHELTHAMGRVPYGPSPDIFDLFRFTSSGTLLISGSNTAPAAYFSLDGGNTRLADFGRTSDPSDFLNSGVQGGSDPFNEFYGGGTIQSLTTVDLKLLDALGFHVPGQSAAPPSPPPQTVIESFGSTSLVQSGSNYFLNSNSTGSGPELMLNGSPVVAGQFAGWTPVGAEQTSSGYQVAMMSTSGSQFIIWTVDSNGAYVTNAAPASSTSTALETAENTFHQDLNHDGVIGIPPSTPNPSPPPATQTVIESFGSTSLVQVGNNYFMNGNGTGSGPELMLNGSPVVAGQFAGWTPVGAEQTSSGYQVAMISTSGSQFIIWTVDSKGAYVTNGAPVSSTSTALETAENTFHQDLNHDGVIGIPPSTPNPSPPPAPQTVIESFGSTSLVQVGNNYFMNSNSTGSGPELMLSGSPVVAGQFAGWTPVGAEQTSSGYQVAMMSTSGSQFIIWTVDSKGAYVTNAAPASSTSTALETAENTFHQDLNHDGVIGVPAPVSPGPSAPLANGPAVTIASNDTFIFGSNALTSAWRDGNEGLSAVAHEMHLEQRQVASQSSFHATHEGLINFIDDGASPRELTGPHEGFFFFH